MTVRSSVIAPHMSASASASAPMESEETRDCAAMVALEEQGQALKAKTE